MEDRGLSGWVENITRPTSIIQTGIQVGGLRYLHYWYWIASADDCGWDFAKIYINGSQQKSLDLCSSSNTSGWVHGLIGFE